jgi:hypothetical protein
MVSWNEQAKQAVGRHGGKPWRPNGKRDAQHTHWKVPDSGEEPEAFTRNACRSFGYRLLPIAFAPARSKRRARHNELKPSARCIGRRCNRYTAQCRFGVRIRYRLTYQRSQVVGRASVTPVPASSLTTPLLFTRTACFVICDYFSWAMRAQSAAGLMHHAG